MLPFTCSIFRRTTALAAGAILACSGSHAFAGAQATADKEVAKQQVEAEQPFKLNFSLTVGGESEFVFRGVDILPEVNIDVPKVFTEAINLTPGLRQTIFDKTGLTPKQFVKNNISGIPEQPVKISRESGLYYVDGNVSATIRGTSVTLGAFYGTQSEDRPSRNFLSSSPLFDEYHEFDAYLSLSHGFGPVRVTLGGTFYHVTNNTDFNTAELNFGVAYTPPQFQYVTASFSYDYAAAFNYSNFNENGVTGSYLDGHYLEARIDGNVPLYKRVITFNPYILVSAGSGILPRAFNVNNLPTYVNTDRYAQRTALLLAANGFGSLSSAPNSAFDPAVLDRSFDLSNFQVGFRVPFYLTRYLTIRGDFNYSRPLGNLDREPYNQKDQIWGGGSVTLTF